MSKKTKISTAVLVLVLTLSTSLVGIMTVTSAGAFDWYPWIAVSADPVGLNQRVLVIFGFTMPTQGIGYDYYDGWMVTITKPDGNIDTRGPLTSDTTGTTYTLIYPDSVGEWKVKATYPGGSVSWFGTSYDIPEISSEEISFTVQADPVPEWQETPLPTEYWQYPIYGENRGWEKIGGQWLMPGYDTARGFQACPSGAYNPYTTAPNQPHIVWTKELLFGGIAGGRNGDSTYYTGSSYRQELFPPIIMNGRLYYNVQDPPQYGFYCVDLYTGETIWYQNQTFLDAEGNTVSGSGAQLSLGQIVTYTTVNSNGMLAYLWAIGGTTWAKYDAFTGNLLATYINARPAGTSINPRPGGTRNTVFQYIDTDGSFYVYLLDSVADTFVMWNSSKYQTPNDYRSGGNIGSDWNLGIEWNVTVPHIAGQAIKCWDPKNNSVIIANNQSRGQPATTQEFYEAAYSGKDGHVLWQKTRNEGTWEYVVDGHCMGDGIFTNFRKETRQLYAFDVNTGNQIWVADPRPSWGIFLNGLCIAYGRVYAAGYDGLVYAYDTQTGNVDWIFETNDVNPSYTETPYGTYTYYGGLVIADGKVFAANQEHSAVSPLYRGESIYAINATTGDLIWKMDGWYQQGGAVANGYMVALNQMDGRIYAFGKGPTNTQVITSQKIATLGDNVLIEGSVTDISPGTEQSQLELRFPNGVPAVSDQNMEDWMRYIYQQQPAPKDVSGVEVILETLDPNNNFYEIGRATSDATGLYSIMWEPPVPGKYTIIARFDGTESYWGSCAETALGVVEAGGGTPIEPEPTEQPTEPEPEAPFITSEVAIILVVAVIAVVAVAAYWILRRRQ